MEGYERRVESTYSARFDSSGLESDVRRETHRSEGPMSPERLRRMGALQVLPQALTTGSGAVEFRAALRARRVPPDRGGGESTSSDADDMQDESMAMEEDDELDDAERVEARARLQ